MRRASVLLELLKFDEDLRQLLKTGQPVKNCAPTQGSLQLTQLPGQVEHLIGVDEAGQHSLAGPVVAGAVSLRQINWNESLKNEMDRLDGSKLVSNTRNKLAEVVIQHTTWAIGQAAVEEIDRLGITAATDLAMKRAVDQLIAKLQITDSNSLVVLIDGRKTIDQLPMTQIPLPAADSQSACVAAASVIAKVHRDNIMKKLSSRHPQYSWEINSGDPSQAHLEALCEHGRTALHRQGFGSIPANLSCPQAPALIAI